MTKHKWYKNYKFLCVQPLIGGNWHDIQAEIVVLLVNNNNNNKHAPQSENFIGRNNSLC